jgi:hypothetical protein
MKSFRLLLFSLLLLAVAACTRGVNFFELATSSPSLSVKVGDRLLPPGTGYHDFGDLEAYTTSVPVVFTVENTSPLKLVINGISFLEADNLSFTKDTSGMSTILGSGQSSSFSVTFIPRAPDDFAATIAIDSNDREQGRYSITVLGTGTSPTRPPPALLLLQGLSDLPSGSTIDFGTVTVGGEAIAELAIRNVGVSGLLIADLGIDPGAGCELGEFSYVSPCLPLYLTAGETGRFSVSFNSRSPLPAGNPPKSALLSILSSDPDDNPYTVTLLGAGSALPLPDIFISQQSRAVPNGTGAFDFNTVQVSESSVSVFSIENRGSAELTVEAIEAQAVTSGAFIVLADPSLFTNGIPPGGTGVFSVEFTPAGAGDASGLIRVENSDPDEDPYTFTVRGIGVSAAVPDIEIEGAPAGSFVDLGLIGLGGSLPRAFKILNAGSAALSVSAPITLNPREGNPASFAVDPQPSGSVSPGGSADFVVVFTPKDLNPASVEVSIASDDPDGVENPYVFEVRARGSAGKEPDIALYQSNAGLPSGGTCYFLGDVPVGGSSGPVVFTIKNEGTGVLSGIGVRFSDNRELDYTLDTQATDQSLSGGQSTSFTVRFTPTKPNKKKAILEIKSNDPDAEGLYILNLEGGKN